MNLSQIKREELLKVLNDIKHDVSDENKLIAINEIENELTSKKYGLVWEKHEEKVDTLLKENVLIFEEKKTKQITSNADKKYNFLLEGDNLHSLYLLNKTHKGKINIIYIDPPYNRGEDDFVYNDDYIDKNDGYIHSKWLSFMQERLNLASDLLSNDGYIFISIGDDEFSQLKLLCDEVFGAKNFVTNFTWIQTTNPPSLGKIRNNMEYIICYQKKKNDIKLFGKASNEKDSPLANKGNTVQKLVIPKGSCHFTDCYENTTIKKGNKESGVKLYTDVDVKNGINENDFIVEFNSKWGQENIYEEIKNGTFFIIKRHEYFSLRYQKGKIGYVVPDKFLNPNKFDVKDNEYGGKQLSSIIGINSFDFPKNTPLIKTLIRMCGTEKKDNIILDFFAGSGTTAQAVMELNLEDNGNRTFIMCTNNENNICEDVTYKRISFLINGERADGTNIVNEVKEPLYSFDITEKLLKNPTALEDEMKKLEDCKADNDANFDTFEKTITNNQYQLYGVRNIQRGLNENLKYFKTNFVSKDSKSLSKELMRHAKELIELEWGISIDKKVNLMVMTEDELDKIAANWDKLKLTVKSIYRARQVVYTGRQKQLFKNINNFIIPDYYFNNELKEVGENW